MTSHIIVIEEKTLMSKWDKLINKVCSLSADIRFKELQKILESYGYSMTQPKSGSSHYVFRKKNYVPIVIPKHEPIKKVYIQMVKEIIEQEEE